jgi:hydroxymethylglutaryl-CoA lyase
VSFPKSVEIIEVGPRDGLQSEKQILATSQKIDFITQLASTGLKTIEVSSFVSPKLIPQLADAAQVLAGLKNQHNIKFPVLVPNEQGMENALQAGANCIAVFSSCSETFSQKNTNCSIAQGLDRIANIMLIAQRHKIPARAYISCALGCPDEGDIDVAITAELARELFSMGCYQISLGDTIGAGTPLKAKQLIYAVAQAIPRDNIAAHFHDTNGQALANIHAALEQGVSAFDSSVAGLGGCPNALGATGNVATENLVYMLHEMGIETGVDLEKLKAVALFIKRILKDVTKA